MGQVTEPSLVNGGVYLLHEVPESESSVYPSVPISRQVWFAPEYGNNTPTTSPLPLGIDALAEFVRKSKAFQKT